jgi:hypothetical protein
MGAQGGKLSSIGTIGQEPLERSAVSSLKENSRAGHQFSMKPMQLEVYVVVVQERSVRKSADSVCRTQPAISIATKKLEAEIVIAFPNRSPQMEQEADFFLTVPDEVVTDCLRTPRNVTIR